MQDESSPFVVFCIRAATCDKVGDVSKLSFLGMVNPSNPFLTFRKRAVGFDNVTSMPKRERDEAEDARIQHMRRAIVSLATRLEVYREMPIRWEPPRDMDKKYVQALAEKEAAKGPDNPTKVNWNWFCGRIFERDGGWDCHYSTTVIRRVDHSDVQNHGK